MKTTVRTLSVCLTKEDNRQLEDLCKHYGEARSKVALRAINQLYHEMVVKVSRETYEAHLNARRFCPLGNEPVE